jgi:SAM-dependent methyltransferase
MLSNNINNTFFNGIYKDVWRKINPPGLTIAETDFIEEIGKLHTGSKVLDVMCGFGRHALELGKRGVFVTAVDNLQDYIDELALITWEHQLPVETKMSDVLHMRLEMEYDAAICMGNSFAFFDKREAIQLLKNISLHLKPGGVLIINSWMIAEIAIRHFKEKEWYLVDDYKCLLAYEYLFNPARIESEQTVIAPNGASEVMKGIDYIYSLDDLNEMFYQAGFRMKDFFSTPRKKKFSLGDSRIYIVAEKN